MLDYIISSVPLLFLKSAARPSNAPFPTRKSHSSVLSSIALRAFREKHGFSWRTSFIFHVLRAKINITCTFSAEIDHQSPLILLCYSIDSIYIVRASLPSRGQSSQQKILTSIRKFPKEQHQAPRNIKRFHKAFDHFLHARINIQTKSPVFCEPQSSLCSLLQKIRYEIGCLFSQQANSPLPNTITSQALQKRIFWQFNWGHIQTRSLNSNPQRFGKGNEDCNSQRSISSHHGGREFVFFDKLDNGRRSQYLSMKPWNVHKDVKNKNGKLIPSLIKRRPVNKMLNNNHNFENEDDILDLLFKRNNIDFKEIRVKQITALNRFYEKTSEVMSSVRSNGSVRSRQSSLYCKVPKIEFKVAEAAPKCFRDIDQEYRFKQQQAIARSFIARGYGFLLFQADNASNTNGVTVEMHRYRNTLGTVLTQSFRKMETFVIEQCCMDLRRINRAELKLLFVTMLNCRSYLSPLDCETFLKFIKMCFYLDDVFITAEASVKLMNAIQEALKKRIHERTGEVPSELAYHTGNEMMWAVKGGFTNEKLQLHRIWNGEMERLLVQSYKKQPDLNRITRHFKKTYPRKQQFFTYDSIKTRLFRTLRQSVKKVQFLRQTEGNEKMPVISKIFKPNFRVILTAPQLYKLRVLLLQVNFSENCDPKLLARTIQSLNDSIIVYQEYRRKQHRRKYGQPQSSQDEDQDLQIDLQELKLIQE